MLFSFIVICLSRAETMPLVTEPKRSNPSGLPIAITSSPTLNSSLSPSVAGVRPVSLTFSTAISVSTSYAIILASCSVSSLKSTETSTASPALYSSS